MPPRLSRPSKVTRTNGSSSSRWRRSLTSAALEEVENYVHTSATDMGPGSIVPRPSSPVSSIDGGDGSNGSDEYNGGNEYNIADTFNGGDGYNSGNAYNPANVLNSANAFNSASAFNSANAFNIVNGFGSVQEPRTAAEIAYEKYGDDVKIDSALCRKVSVEVAHRLPLQRREHQKLNMERRSNLEALLSHMTGEQVSNPCKNCRKGHGPWQHCVVYDGQMCGSCTNCWYNASGSRCTFHCNAAVAAAAVRSPPQPIIIPNATLHGMPAGSSDSRTNLPYYTPRSETGPKREWGLETGQSLQSHPPLLTPSVLPTPTLSFNLSNFHPLLTNQVVPALHQGLGGNVIGTPLWDATSNPPGNSTSQLLNRAMNHVSQLSPLARHFARMESGAEELAHRIDEFHEYLRTPEGMAEYSSCLEAADGGFLLQEAGEIEQSPSAGAAGSGQDSPIFDDGHVASFD